MITAYDYAFARLADEAGVDALLVGDSLGMAVAGAPDTIGVDLEQVEYHTKLVARGRNKALLMADLPFGAYETGPRQAFASAARLLKAGADTIKLEGGATMVETVAYLSARTVPVCSHIGLTPQHVRQFGGFIPQGKTPEAAERLIQDAVALAEAGARMLVMEAIPSDVAATITKRISVPTIGIGAGPETDGQGHGNSRLPPWRPLQSRTLQHRSRLADVAETYAPVKITVAYAGQAPVPKLFIMILEWSRAPSGWKMATDVALPIPPPLDANAR